MMLATRGSFSSYGELPGSAGSWRWLDLLSLPVLSH